MPDVYVPAKPVILLNASPVPAKAGLDVCVGAENELKNFYQDPYTFIQPDFIETQDPPILINIFFIFCQDPYTFILALIIYSSVY